MAVQIGYGNAISTECKPLKSNDLAREVHCSNIVIFRYISNAFRKMQSIFQRTSSGVISPTWGAFELQQWRHGGLEKYVLATRRPLEIIPGRCWPGITLRGDLYVA